MKEKILNLITQGKTQRQIAEELEKSQTSVRYWLKKFKLKTQTQTNSVSGGFKRCSKCKLEKKIIEFYKRTDKKNSYTSWCKNCSNEYYAKRVRDVKIKMINHKGGSCERCGLNINDTHYSVFDFHHKNPEEKDINFDKIKYQKWEKIEKEIEKCKLLCSNCHRIEHAEIGGY